MIGQSQSQSPRQAQRPVTTAHLAQTMTLLELSSVELGQKIEAELSRNPALELLEEVRCPQCHRLLTGASVCPVCSQRATAIGQEPIVFVSPRTDFAVYDRRLSVDDLPNEEWAAETEDLPTYILRQIAPELDPEDRLLAAHILTSLDDDGLLTISLAEIALFHHVRLLRVETILHMIQRADPVGAGSPTPQEALLVQLEVLSENNLIPEIATRAVQEGMDLLSRHAYSELGRRLGVTTRQAQETAHWIGENLNPYPARAHWGGIRHSTRSEPDYPTPDVIISCLNDRQDTALVVEVVSPYAGRLRINSLFRQAVNQAPVEKTDQWQADLEGATLLVKCLQQRDHTLVRLMQRMAVLQRAFVLNGDAYLLPVTRASLADELEVHESTISRAVSGKAVQLPSGRIIPMARMFDRSLHVRTALREIVASEHKPLSDTQIARLLDKRGFSVARRTVAKYRNMEGILPARLRSANLK